MPPESSSSLTPLPPSPGPKSTPPAPAPVLDYAPPRRRFPRWAVYLASALCLLLILYIVLRPFLAPYWDQAALLRLQQSAASRILPSGQIVYAEIPGIIAILEKRPNYHPSSYGINPSSPYTGSIPPSWPQPCQYDYPSIRLPIAGASLADMHGILGCWRKDELGNDLLVHLGLSLFPMQDNHRGVCITQRTVTKASWRLGSRGIDRSFMGFGFLLAESDRLTLLAPQPDPYNPTRIIIPYDINGTPGTLTATVSSTGRVVTAITSGPAAPVTKW